MASNSQEMIAIGRRKCNIRVYLENVLKPLRPQAEAMDIGLNYTLLSEIPSSISIDPEKIAWIVTSLVGNAFRYVRHGTRNLPGGFVQVELGYDSNKQILLINVKDDGPGIPADRVPWLGQPAQQPDDKPISGLALKLAHEIIVAHGGKIAAESRTSGDQRGTAFLMEIPAPLMV